MRTQPPKPKEEEVKKRRLKSEEKEGGKSDSKARCDIQSSSGCGSVGSISASGSFDNPIFRDLHQSSTATRRSGDGPEPARRGGEAREGLGASFPNELAIGREQARPGLEETVHTLGFSLGVSLECFTCLEPEATRGGGAAAFGGEGRTRQVGRASLPHLAVGSLCCTVGRVCSPAKRVGRIGGTAFWHCRTRLRSPVAISDSSAIGRGGLACTDLFEGRVGGTAETVPSASRQSQAGLIEPPYHALAHAR